MSYIGAQPIPRVSRVRTYGSLVSSTNTINIPGGFTPGNIEVFIDGFYVKPSDYDESNGFDLVFIDTLNAGTDYIVVEARAFEVSGVPTLQGGSQANFVTMPQVGGDPIVESGSNADGEWIKWADGTLYCQTTGDVTFTYGGGDLIQYPWTFPVPFVGDLPFVTFELTSAANLTINVLDSGWSGRLMNNKSLNTVNLRQYTNNSGFLSADTAPGGAFAAGRWK